MTAGLRAGRIAFVKIINRFLTRGAEKMCTRRPSRNLTWLLRDRPDRPRRGRAWAWTPAARSLCARHPLAAAARERMLPAPASRSICDPAEQERGSREGPDHAEHHVLGGVSRGRVRGAC